MAGKELSKQIKPHAWKSLNTITFNLCSILDSPRKEDDRRSTGRRKPNIFKALFTDTFHQKRKDLRCDGFVAAGMRLVFPSSMTAFFAQRNWVDYYFALKWLLGIIKLIIIINFKECRPEGEQQCQRVNLVQCMIELWKINATVFPFPWRKSVDKDWKQDD